MKTLWKQHLTDSGAEFDDTADGNIVMHYGNPEQEQEVAVSGTVFTDLTHLGIIAVHGADAQPFLQSQLGNDITALDSDHSQLSSYCTPKGRMLGLFRIFRSQDSFYLRLPADSLDAVLQRLRMFVLRADATLEDASEAFIRIGVAGRKAADVLAAATGQALPAGVNDTGYRTAFGALGPRRAVSLRFKPRGGSGAGTSTRRTAWPSAA